MLLKGGGGSCHPKEKSVLTSPTEMETSECLFQSPQSLLSRDHRRWTSFSPLPFPSVVTRDVSLMDEHTNSLYFPHAISKTVKQCCFLGLRDLIMSMCAWVYTCVCMLVCVCACGACAYALAEQGRRRRKSKTTTRGPTK